MIETEQVGTFAEDIELPDFTERDRLVKLLGFADYKEYLQSETWSWIKVRSRPNWELMGLSPQCFACLFDERDSNFHMHHRRYTLHNLAGTPTPNLSNEIVPVCNECHLQIHKQGNEWLPLNVVDLRLLTKRWRSFMWQKLKCYSHVPMTLYEQPELPTSLECGDEVGFDDFVLQNTLFH